MGAMFYKSGVDPIAVHRTLQVRSQDRPNGGPVEREYEDLATSVTQTSVIADRE